MSNHADLVKRLRSVCTYLHSVAHTADQLQRAGVSVAVDLSDMRGNATALSEVIVELLVLEARAKADVVLANPPFRGPIS